MTDVVRLEGNPGERVTFVLPEIPDDAPTDLREGIARRRLVSLTGECPCGARLQIPSRAERRAAQRSGQVMRVGVAHEDGCPATDEAVGDALRRWRSS